MQYQYPISLDWSTDEVVDVVNFFQCVEKAYEKGIDRQDFLAVYHRFKQVVPAKSEEKRLCGEFEKASGYSCYKAVKKAGELKQGEKLKM